MSKYVFNENSLRLVVDSGDQPEAVSADIEDGENLACYRNAIG
jgi:hypothetical protein